MTHVDLFAGGGGFSRGALLAGIEPTLAVENAPGPSETYAHNFPGARLVSEAAQRVDWKALAAEAGAVALLTAGPPCEPYTPASAGRYADPLARLYNDPVGGLMLHTIRAIRAFEPEVFVIENVVQVAEGPLRRELADLLRRAGYDVHFNVLEAHEHGNPSRRARVFLSNRRIAPPKEPHITVREAIEDLEMLDEAVPNHFPDKVPRKFREDLERLRPGRSLQFWKGATGKTYGTWTRLAYDEVAPTIKGSGRFIHPVLDRALTPREHARLMGFPDEHLFLAGLGSQYDQVGEAVPPPLGRAIVRETVS